MDIPAGCSEKVVCNGIEYDTIADALEDNPCAGEILLGCGIYQLPLMLIDDLCIKGKAQCLSYINTEPGQKIVNDNVSFMDITFVSCGDRVSTDAGLVCEAANLYLKNVVFNYLDKRQVDLYVTNSSTRVSLINCEFSGSANYGI